MKFDLGPDATGTYVKVIQFTPSAARATRAAVLWRWARHSNKIGECSFPKG